MYRHTGRTDICIGITQKQPASASATKPTPAHQAQTLHCATSQVYPVRAHLTPSYVSTPNKPHVTGSLLTRRRPSPSVLRLPRKPRRKNVNESKVSGKPSSTCRARTGNVAHATPRSARSPASSPRTPQMPAAGHTPCSAVPPQSCL